MSVCPSCNTPNEDGAVFCDHCGANLVIATNGAVLAPEAVNAPNGMVCPVCGAAAMNGDAFCNDCGADLRTSPHTPATPIQTAFAPAVPVEQAQIILSDGQNVVLAGKSSYLIGREDPMSGIFPEVDTTRSDGDAAGVSRRHAEVTRQSNQWFLQDLNSTNGTFVNNQRVPPQAQLPLHSGDQIRLGRWVATFQVQ
ncbi:MAG: FHA domain-containing protein [Anaerolineales bacterium]|nr:FHA domain-containing protein [Anaerolineales bacterium]